MNMKWYPPVEIAVPRGWLLMVVCGLAALAVPLAAGAERMVIAEHFTAVG